MPAIIFGTIFSFIVFGALCSSLAKHKGYNENIYFWTGLFLGIIGLFYVGCLPSKHINIDESKLVILIAKAIRMADEETYVDVFK